MRGTRLPATVPNAENAAETAKRGPNALTLALSRQRERGLDIHGYTANVAVGVSDPVRTLYRTLLAYGAFATLILVAGVAEYVHFEPFTSGAGLHAKVVGVYLYDPATKQPSGPGRESFARKERFDP